MFIIISKYLIPKGYSGLSVFPFIFIKKKKDTKNLILLNHEKIHIRQQIELLIVPFYILYLLHFIFNLIKYKDHNQAYRNIVFEKEAYQNEQNLEYLNTRKIWAFRKY